MTIIQYSINNSLPFLYHNLFMFMRKFKLNIYINHVKIRFDKQDNSNLILFPLSSYHHQYLIYFFNSNYLIFSYVFIFFFLYYKNKVLNIINFEHHKKIYNMRHTVHSPQKQQKHHLQHVSNSTATYFQSTKINSININVSKPSTKIISSSVKHPNQYLTMTIKQQQTIQQILQQTLKSSNTSKNMQSLNIPSNNTHPTISYPHHITVSETTYQLDQDIDRLLKQSQYKIEEQYQNNARQQFIKNRLGISFQDQHDQLKQIFQRMDQRSERSFMQGSKMSKSQREDRESEGFDTAFNLDIRKLRHNYNQDPQLRNIKNKQFRSRSYSNNQIPQIQQLSLKIDNRDSSDSSNQYQHQMSTLLTQKQLLPPKQISPYILDLFQQTQILKPKQQSLQILQLDQKYPKINLTSMYNHQYPIFKINQSSTTKYLRFLKKFMNQIQCAVSFYANNAVKWTILAIDGQDWKQPTIVNPHRNSHTTNNLPPITSLSLSKSNNYLAVSLLTQIIIYLIKKQNNSLVLIKNLSHNNDLSKKLTKITKVIIYSQNPIKLMYIDNRENVGIIICQTMMMFMRVNQKQILHGEKIIMNIDVLMIQVSAQSLQNSQTKPSKFSFNKKISNLISKPNSTYCAIASNTTLLAYKIQPNYQIIHKSLLHEQPGTPVTIRWRYHNETQTKPQLLVSYNNKIYIYKLIQPQNNTSHQPYLQLHLLYKNHYDIKQMEIISSTHLLLHSNQNIIVISIPLIASTDLSSLIAAEQMDHQDDNKKIRIRKNSQCNNQMFQSALIFITNQKDCRILYASQQQIIYFSNNQEILRIAVLKRLQQYLDQLMLQQSHFRQAFTLLILIYKGVNYSFKFSYTSQALSQCIFAAIQCTIATIKLSMNDNIIEYRLGWVCQLLIQTHNENLIWSTVYKKLQEKQKQRQKQWNATMVKASQQAQKSKLQNNYRDSYSEKLILTNESHRKIDRTHQFQDIRRKNFLSHGHSSLILEHTTSSQLLCLPPKNLEYILFDILEVFVLKSQITSMPENVFFDFVSYECQKMSDTVIEKVIIQNKQAYDGSKLLSLLHNKERNYLQLYLFSRAIICEEADFYTPFIKVFSSFKKDNETLDKVKSNQKDQQLIKKVQNTGLMCLWYLSKCFRFQHIPLGIMDLNQKITILNALCPQIIDPMFTRKLFEFNNKVFLQTMLLLFLGGELSILIEEQNQVLVQKYKQFYSSTYQQIMSMPASQSQSKIKQKQEKTQTQQIYDKSFKQLLLLHLQITVPMLNNQRLLWAEFQAVAFYFSKNQICLTFQATVDILIILFQNKFENYSLHVPHKLNKRPTVQQLELSLIQYIKPVLVSKKDRFYINKLIGFNDKNVSYQLHRIDQSYKLALEHFLSSKEPQKLIPFIYQLLGDIKQLCKNPDNHIERSLKERKFADIKQFLVKNIGTIFNIDKFEALNIFYQIGETSQTINKLIQQNMGNKLNFLTAVLKKFQYQDFDMKQKFQLEHLSEVCTQKDKKMLEFLDTFFYPLDSAIIVCQQKGNLLAKAIFEQRCGKITDAFMSYQRIIKNIIQSNNPVYKQKSQRKIKRDVHKYTQQCLRLCKQYAYDPSAAPQNNFWLRILTFINGFIKSNNQQKVFLKVEFEKVLQHILREMFQFLPTTLLVDFFITKGHRLQLSMNKQFAIFQNLFTLGKFDIGVAKKVLEICKIDIKDTRKQALLKRKKGIISFGSCDFCKKSLLQQIVCNLYSCHHSFHKICHDDVYKCLTCYYQSDNSIVSSNIFGTQMHKILPQDQLSQKQNHKIALKNKSLKQMKNIDVIVQSAQAANQQQLKKKMKIYDFNEQKINEHFYKIVQSYNQKDKEMEKYAAMDKFQNDYLKYSKEGGLQIKAKRNITESQDGFSINYADNNKQPMNTKKLQQI